VTVASPPPSLGGAPPPPVGAVASPPPPAVAVAWPPPPAGGAPPPAAGALPCSSLTLLSPGEKCNDFARRNPVECPKFSTSTVDGIRQCKWNVALGACRFFPDGQFCMVDTAVPRQASPPPPARAVASPPPPPPPMAVTSPPPPPPAGAVAPPPAAGAISCSSLTLLGSTEKCNDFVRRNPVECPKFAKEFDGQVQQCTWDSAAGLCRGFGPMGVPCLR
jgi:hypothetical protein